MGQARARLAASAARQWIEIAGLQGPELGSVVQGLQALVVAGQEAAAASSASEAMREAMERLQLEEAEQRSAIAQAAGLAVMEQQAELVQRSLLCLLEQREAAERAMVWAADSAATVSLAGQQPAVRGRLVEAQAALESRREEVAGLSEALEEKEMELGRVSRELEALRDAQATADASSVQREMQRAEGEQRAAVATEQRAAWAMLEEMARHDRASDRRQALVRVMEAEPRVALGR